jgi:hypothetical protein
MIARPTERGFLCIEFEDRYGNQCSLQESSLADDEGHIWFGTEGKVMVGPPWVEFKMPDNALVHSRMHLSQSQVKELLPQLRYFAEHGRLTDKVEKENKLDGGSCDTCQYNPESVNCSLGHPWGSNGCYQPRDTAPK